MRFAEYLLIGTAITGAVWVLDTVFLRPRRMMYVVQTKDQAAAEPWWVEYSKSFFPILLIVFILRSFLAEPFRIPSGSMRPTLLEGDFIVVNKYDYGLRWPIVGKRIINIGEPKRGDVIVFKGDNYNRKGESMDMIKRVVGLPNDHIQYKNKTLYINGEPVKQEFQTDKLDVNPNGAAVPVRELIEYLGDAKHEIYTQPAANHDALYQYHDVTVPPNHYFVMGDNRDFSADSRFWGFVKDEDVQGRAFLVWMSFEGTHWYWPWPIRWKHLGWIH